WLGSLNSEISTCGFWAKDLRTLADLRRREVVVGSTGPASGSTVDAKILGPLAGINFKVVTSYPGLTEVRLAAERGEVDGHCGLQVSPPSRPWRGTTSSPDASRCRCRWRCRSTRNCPTSPTPMISPSR